MQFNGLGRISRILPFTMLPSLNSFKLFEKRSSFISFCFIVYVLKPYLSFPSTRDDSSDGEGTLRGVKKRLPCIGSLRCKHGKVPDGRDMFFVHKRYPSGTCAVRRAVRWQQMTVAGSTTQMPPPSEQWRQDKFSGWKYQYRTSTRPL